MARGIGARMTANFGGTPSEIEWPPIASATHVVLSSNHHLPIRLVVRENSVGQWLICIEAYDKDGKITRPVQMIGERSTAYSTMQAIANRFQLPPWLVDRCLLSLRDSVKDLPATHQTFSVK
jgi:hypothetical protein